MFTTERLLLREFRPETDAADYLRLRNNLEIQQTMSGDYIVPVTRKSVEKRFEAFGGGGNFLFHAVVVLKATGVSIGFASVMQTSPKNRDGALGIAVLPEYWSAGYGTEAMRFVIGHCFDFLGLHRVSVGVFGNNARALNMFKAAGFTLEGTRRQANWVDGKWQDTHTMGMLEHEWRVIKEEKQASIAKSASQVGAPMLADVERTFEQAE